MKEKAKLYVFDRTEVWIIFLFMIVTAVVSFTLGINVGKNYSFSRDGFTLQDKNDVEKTVDMVSQEEEKVNKVLEKNEDVSKEQVREDSYNRLKQEIDKELSDDTGSQNETRVQQQEPEQVQTSDVAEPVQKEMPKTEEVVDSGASSTDNYAGKYTIQLGSHRSIEDAEKFASGFRVRGYSPIINEVEIKSRGTWYRVSLGVFETVTEAKNYILDAKSLFQGQDYVIAKFE